MLDENTLFYLYAKNIFVSKSFIDQFPESK